jgi:N-acyl-L-homoserine lactone synthetase
VLRVHASVQPVTRSRGGFDGRRASKRNRARASAVSPVTAVSSSRVPSSARMARVAAVALILAATVSRVSASGGSTTVTCDTSYSWVRRFLYALFDLRRLRVSHRTGEQRPGTVSLPRRRKARRTVLQSSQLLHHAPRQRPMVPQRRESSPMHVH